MTETTDIAALREAALKATAGEWCTDSQHSVIADAGMNANYYVAACSGPDSQINASFIALANPAAIIAILDQLEAERQRADDLEAVALAMRDDMRVAREELAELRGEQGPYGYYSAETATILEQKGYASISAEPLADSRFPLFTGQPKPVVVHPDTVRMDWLCAHVVEVRQPMFYGSHAMFFGQCDSADDEEYHSKLREQIDAAIKADGNVVKDGE